MIKSLKGKLAKRIWTRQPTKKMLTKYRVCFYWQGGNAYEVEIVDYH